MSVTRLSIVGWVYSKTQLLLGTLRIQNQLGEESYVLLEVEHLFLVKCVRNKRQYPTVLPNQKSFISLDAGLRTNGFPAFDLWDVVMEVLRSSNTKQAAGNCLRNRTSKHKQKGNRDVDQLSHVDHVTANAHSSQGESQLYIFEGGDAVIKMIITGRSPTMRHASRTHRVALDWLFDRINLDPQIQIKYVDTKNQLADMLTQGNFTRDEWDHLLRLLNTMNLSTFSCSHFLSFKQKAECHVLESSRNLSERRVGSGEAAVNLVSKNLMSDMQDPPQAVIDPNSPRNRGLDQSCVLASDR